MATSPAPTESCRFLALPGEIRNYIYQFVATQDDAKHIDLFAARPPGPALAQTCRKIRSETMSMVTKAEEHYWSSNHFIADVSRLVINAREHYWSSNQFIADVSRLTYDDISSKLDRLGHRTISLIQNIEVRGAPQIHGAVCWTLKDRIWSYPCYYGGTFKRLVVEGSGLRSPFCIFLHGRDPIEGKVMAYIVLDDLPQNGVDEAKRLHCTARLTRRELERVMRNCAGEWKGY